jgi:hypothetical protein
VANSFNDLTSSLKISAVSTVTAAKPQTALITSSGIRIFPNPVLNELQLLSSEDLTGALIKVYDFSGREVLQKQNLNNRLNVSRLSAGVYTLTIIKNGKITTGRFIK